ncbi:MAG: 30S ribosomal protein S8, partial [Candidatus Niyogibacteria bacterium]|nr:30S ribosomal protein S8 [Candidatus Niyogibacteria bacterium]
NVTLLYGKDGKGRMNGVERVSKPSRRVYIGATDIRPVFQGKGIAVISTSKGLLTGKEAKKQKIGGEVLFKIW